MSSVDRAQWDAEGYVVVRSLFSPAEAATLRDHYMSLNGQGAYLHDGIDMESQDPLAQYPRIVHPHRWDETSLQTLADPRFHRVLVGLLDEEPYLAQSMVYFKAPGARGQALHQDNLYLRAAPGTCVAAWLALDDCDEANGCMQVVPGSHQLPLLCNVPTDTSSSFTATCVPVPDGYQPVPAVMKAGDVLFFHGATIHGSYPNTTKDRFRRAFIAHYITADAKIVHEFYHPVLDWNGQEVPFEGAAEGGACGALVHGPDGEEIVMVPAEGIRAAGEP